MELHVRSLLAAATLAVPVASAELPLRTSRRRRDGRDGERGRDPTRRNRGRVRRG